MPASAKDDRPEILILGGRVYTSRIVLSPGWVHIRGGTIQDVQPGDPPPSLTRRKVMKVVDVAGRIVAPGLIDLHVHGAGGGDVGDAAPASIAKISKVLARFGVTGFLASVYPASRRRMLDQIRAARQAVAAGPPGAAVIGVHLEGPYLNRRRKGALSGRHLRDPDIDEMQTFIKEGEGLVRMMTIAPELPGAIDMVKLCREQHIRTAVGHSDASHEQMIAGIAAGISHVTHAFNALRRTHHRDPGVMGTVLTVDEVSLEMIVDFVHLHPRVVELLLITKPHDRLVLVSDALRVTGLRGRQFLADRKEVRIVDAVARQADGTIAGSVLTLNRAIANVVSLNRATFNAALKMATLVPARCIHIEDRKGCLIHDKDADIAVFDDDMTCVLTLVRGKTVYDAGVCNA